MGSYETRADVLALGHDENRWAERRARMVQRQLKARGIESSAVLDAMGIVPRERFVGPGEREQAYRDCALPIACGQTISQPYIVALMTELSGARAGSRVLEVGTGSGYQAAVLATLGAEVWSVERIPQLAEEAERLLKELGLSVHTRLDNGALGWPEAAPFEAILVTAAPESVPMALLEQLAPQGRLVVPVGASGEQMLTVVRRTGSGFEQERIVPVRFVPLLD